MNVKTKGYTLGIITEVFARTNTSKEEIALEIEAHVANVQEPS